MRERFLTLSHYLLVMILTLLLASAQTSLWFQVLGYFPAPALWLPVLIYVAIFRPLVSAEIHVVLISVVLSTMTVMPFPILLSICLLLALAARALKDRFFWPRNSYYMLIAGLGSLVFHLLHWGLSWVIGEHPLTSPEILDWLVEALLTPLFAPIVIRIMFWIDRVTGREQPVEAGA